MISLIEAVESGVATFAFSLMLTYLYSRRRGAEILDAAWQIDSAKKRQEISEQRNTIESLTTKPKRTAAEEHHYASAKDSLDKLGPECVIALRHLDISGSLLYGRMDPPAPKGMIARDVRAFLNLCVDEQLVTKETINTPSGLEFNYKSRSRDAGRS
jgi:hypothetical protein